MLARVGRSLLDYYSRRAPEYEAIYGLPERQADLAALEARLALLCSEGRVLEVACGTGYWTQRLARVAESIIGTDISMSVLRIASQKHYACSTRFVAADALLQQPLRCPFDVVVAGFWWSHIPLGRLANALRALRPSASPSLLVLFDNRFLLGSSSPIAASDAEGNTYQQRTLSDGSQHMVLKNYPSMSDVLSRLDALGAVDSQILQLAHYWLASCRLPPAAYTSVG